MLQKTHIWNYVSVVCWWESSMDAHWRSWPCLQWQETHCNRVRCCHISRVGSEECFLSHLKVEEWKTETCLTMSTAVLWMLGVFMGWQHWEINLNKSSSIVCGFINDFTGLRLNWSLDGWMFLIIYKTRVERFASFYRVLILSFGFGLVLVFCFLVEDTRVVFFLIFRFKQPTFTKFLYGETLLKCSQ